MGLTFPSQILQKRRKRRKRRKRLSRKRKKLLMIRRRRTKKRPTQTKRRKRRRRRRSPSNLLAHQTIETTTTTRKNPLESLPHSLQQAKKIKTKFKKICTNSYTLAHSTSFPNDIVPPRSRSVIRTE